MKKLILYGLNSLAEEIVRISLLESEYKISYICVDQKYKNGSFYQGVPIIAFEALDTLDMEQFEILITFGYTSMNKLKMSKFRLCKRQGYTLTNFISDKASVYTDDIGESNIIMPHSIISKGVHLGDCNTIYPSVVIGHDCRVGNFNFIASCVDILGRATIGDRCFVGGNSTILDTRKLADATLVGAGAVISQNTKPGQVFVPPRSTLLEKSSEDFI
jgi:sugar O-acyltransferase (sialic acid O-acetyltransferase NeuD family)